MSQGPQSEQPGVPGGPPPPPPPTGPVPLPPPAAQPGWSAPPAGSAGTSPPAWGPASPTAQAGWDAPRTGADSGCLRACLIVGLILAGLAVAGIVALVALGGRLAQEIAENPEAVFGGPCPHLSSLEVARVIDRDVEVLTLEGLADGTMGALLDKRLLPDAEDCWVVSDDGLAGRIAVQDGDGPDTFADARSRAEDRFLAGDVPGLGDEAFCTTLSEIGSAGVLVRWNERVVYVSVLDDGLPDEGRACGLAQEIARLLAP